MRGALGRSYRAAIGEELYRKGDLFDQSANYARPGDRHKRHAHKPSPRRARPKAKEMSLADAEGYTRDVVTAFLERQAKRALAPYAGTLCA